CRPWLSSSSADRHGLADLRVFLGERDVRVLAHEDVIDEAVGLRLFRAHEAVTVDVALDLLDLLPAVVGDDLEELVDERLELLHLDLHVGCVAAEPAGPPWSADPFLEQPREDVVGALASAGLLDDHRYVVRRRHVALLAKKCQISVPTSGDDSARGNASILGRVPRSLVVFIAASSVYAALVFLA